MLAGFPAVRYFENDRQTLKTVNILFAGNKAKYLLLSAFVLFGACRMVHAAESAQDAQKFKLGFEFQESSHLCPWAVPMSDIQKKPIFMVSKRYDGGEPQKLWHLVIDGSDIEFVTEPFCSDKRTGAEHLALCMASIQLALSVLQNQMNRADKQFTEQEIELPRQIEKKKQELKESQKDFIRLQHSCAKTEFYRSTLQTARDQLNEMNSEISEEVQAGLMTARQDVQNFGTEIARIEQEIAGYVLEIASMQTEMERIRTNTATLSFKDWIKRLESKLQDQEQLKGIILQETGNFISAHNLQLQLPKRYPTGEWSPRLNPQATLQHDLKNTIPIYFSLFLLGSEGRIRKDWAELEESDKMCSRFLAAWPYFDRLAMHIENSHVIDLDQYLHSAAYGLVFLHGLTVIGMSRSAVGSNKKYYSEDDKDALSAVRNRYIASGQIDAKMFVDLMSRRSFSDMYQNIGQVERSFGAWKNLYKDALIDGNKFFREAKITTNFYKVNYGMQFFDTKGSPMTLTPYKAFLEEDFYKSNKTFINELLANGILCTPMLRHFKTVQDLESPKQRLENLFQQAVETVENPSQTPRLQLHAEDLQGNVSALENGRAVIQSYIIPPPVNAQTGYGHDALMMRFPRPGLSVKTMRWVNTAENPSRLRKSPKPIKT